MWDFVTAATGNSCTTPRGSQSTLPKVRGWCQPPVAGPSVVAVTKPHPGLRGRDKDYLLLDGQKGKDLAGGL